MRTKTFRYGIWYFKAYRKTVGHGYEVGLTHNQKPIFVGNFIHSREADRWWTEMTGGTTHFLNRFWPSGTTSRTWYCTFLSNYLYKTYYTFLDRLFTGYNRNYGRAFTTNCKQYRTLTKRHTTEHTTYTRAA
jgi:hypothetical protein